MLSYLILLTLIIDWSLIYEIFVSEFIIFICNNFSLLNNFNEYTDVIFITFHQNHIISKCFRAQIFIFSSLFILFDVEMKWDNLSLSM